jgi:glycosyltransferase involved in cell wall biosynthesis
MKVVIDAVGIRGHGGASVLCELLNWLPIVRPEWKWHVFVFERDLREFDDPAVSQNVVLEHVAFGDSGRDRLIWVNTHLPKRLRDIGADVLFSFANIAPAKAVVPQMVFCQHPGAFSYDGIPAYALRWRVRLRFLRREILRGARASGAVIVQTKALCNRIEQCEPRLKERLHVIPSGYRTPPKNPVIREKVRALIESATHPRLIYVSHPGLHKNHLTLVKALPLMTQALPGVRLLLPLDLERENDRPYTRLVEAIRNEANRLGVRDGIVWLGCLSHDEVDFALRASDLMVFPSLSESFGLGLVESMAAGCPIAAADLPYAHDVCGDAAIYFNPERPESLAEVNQAVCSDPATLDRLRAAGSARQVRFSYEKIAEELALMLEKTAQNGAEGTSRES